MLRGDSAGRPIPRGEIPRSTFTPCRFPAFAQFERMLDWLYELRSQDDRLLYRLYVRYARVFWHEAIAELIQV
jgi:hypothetical protein